MEAALLNHCCELAEGHKAGVGVILEGIWAIRKADNKVNPLRNRGLVACFIRAGEYMTGESLCHHYFSPTIPDTSRNLRNLYL